MFFSCDEILLRKELHKNKYFVVFVFALFSEPRTKTNTAQLKKSILQQNLNQRRGREEKREQLTRTPSKLFSFFFFNPKHSFNVLFFLNYFSHAQKKISSPSFIKNKELIKQEFHLNVAKIKRKFIKAQV